MKYEHIDSLLFSIREAQSALEDQYPEYTDFGKEFCVLKAVQALRRAHQLAAYINATSPDSSGGGDGCDSEGGVS